ncbi:MAG: class I SAM-dependent methyltransferase [Nitrospinota bacterium]
MGNAEIQGKLWGAAARDWADLQEPTAKRLWEAMLEAAGVAGGTRLLDAGCGSGGACVVAQRRGAHVSGIDASQALIAIASERVPSGDFRVGDLEELPYDEGAFDAIIASRSVEYTADPVAALVELKRVCVAGGRVVVATWGAPENCEMRVVFEAVRDIIPDPPKGLPQFALSAPGALEELVGKAGLKAIGSGEAENTFVYPDLEACWRAQRSAGPLQGTMRTIGEERLKAAVLKACEPYRTSSGEVRLENTMRYVTATA